MERDREVASVPSGDMANFCFSSEIQGIGDADGRPLPKGQAEQFMRPSQDSA